MKEHFYNSFVRPFRSKTRLTLFIAQLLGAMAVGFLSVFVTLDIVNFGVSGMTLYSLVRFGFAGFVLFPLLTILYLFAPRFVFLAAVLLTQLMALIPLFIPSLSHDPLGLAFGIALSGTAYWQVYHLAMTAQTSEAGRGYEVSLAQILMTLGSAAGAVVGGLAAATAQDISLVLYAYILQLIASLIFCLLIPPAQRKTVQRQEGQVSVSSLWHEVVHHPYRTVTTLVEAVYSLLGEILRPAWLKLIGVAALGVGVVSGLVIIMQAVMAPLAGKFYTDDKLMEMRWGSALLGVAWLPWVLVVQTTTLFFSVPLWAAGTMLLQTGLGSRWYRDRSVTAILTRELLLTVMRLLAIVFVIPVLFHRPDIFAVLAITACFFLFVLAHHWGNKITKC